jgi:hypothetical protein
MVNPPEVTLTFLMIHLTEKDFEPAFGPGAQMAPNIDNSGSVAGPVSRSMPPTGSAASKPY